MKVDLSKVGVPTEAQQRAIVELLNILADRDSDRCFYRNEAGFNLEDSELGHYLAETGMSMSDTEFKDAKDLLFKYHRQLPADTYRFVFGSRLPKNFGQ